jgi:iron complex transport system substrate-binding protein
MRVVSLLPGATEMVATLGRIGSLVGVTHECDHPAEVRSLPRVTRSAVASTATAAVVDAEVSALSASGTPLFEMFEDEIRALRPDLILTQALCDVCAVVETDVRALASRLVPAPAIVTCSASSLDGVFDDVVRVGSALGVVDAASVFVREARARLLTVHETLKAARAPRPRVAVIEWGAPVYAAGHWMPEMVRRAGVVDVLATAGAHSVRVAAGDVERADPEVIVIAPCGYDLARSVAEATTLLARAEWRWASERRVVAIDANAYASRPGPRLVDGVEILARLFHEPLFTPLDPRSAQVLTA